MSAAGLGRLANEGHDSRPASSRARADPPPGAPAPNSARGGPGWETIELGAAAQTPNPAAQQPPRSPLLERGNRLPDEHGQTLIPDHNPDRKGTLARAESVFSAVTAGPMPWDGPVVRRDAENAGHANGPTGEGRPKSGDLQAKARLGFGHASLL